MTIIFVDHLLIQTDEKDVQEIKDIVSKLFPEVDFSSVNGFIPIYTRDKFNLYFDKTCLGSVDCYEVELAECEWCDGQGYKTYESTNLELNQVLYDLLERFDCHR